MAKPGDVVGVVKYVVKQAPRYQLDANAVVAVAIQEGLMTKGGAPGDNGTSFGPWQLHQGGAYPASAPQQVDAANAWAWSDQGIDYALGRMQSVAGGLKGRPAVRAIVYRFERPKDPATEYKNAVQALPSNDGGPSGGSLAGPIGDIISGVYHGSGIATGVGIVTGAVGTGESIVSGTEAVGHFLGNLTNPAFILRGLEIIGGGLFVLFGLYLLGRQSGVVNRAQGTAAKVAAVIPETRAVAPAIQAKAEAGRQRRAAAKAKRQRRRELDEKYGAEAPF